MRGKEEALKRSFPRDLRSIPGKLDMLCRKGVGVSGYGLRGARIGKRGSTDSLIRLSIWAVFAPLGKGGVERSISFLEYESL